MKDKFTCLVVDWDYAYNLCRDVSERIKAAGFMPEVIIGVARGGWYLARVLCDFFMVKDLFSLKMEHWGVTATVTGAAELKFGLDSEAQKKLKGKRVLIADDVTDTGDSIKFALEYVSAFEPLDVKTATMHHKTSSSFMPDFYGELMTEWRWIIYPWSVYEDMMELMEKMMEKRSGKADLEEIRSAMKDEYDLYIPYHLLREVLANMESHGKLRSEEQGGKVFWVMQ
ncbi:MAG: phosphoribosyltransferase [Candidatus Methanophagaceae archaeon]|nr:MAG: phosphoribosyltransferase [Methanophagales archaeon]